MTFHESDASMMFDEGVYIASFCILHDTCRLNNLFTNPGGRGKIFYEYDTFMPFAGGLFITSFCILIDTCRLNDLSRIREDGGKIVTFHESWGRGGCLEVHVDEYYILLAKRRESKPLV